MIDHNEAEKIKGILDKSEKVLLTSKQGRIAPGGSLFTPSTIFLTNKRVIIRDPTMLGLRVGTEYYFYRNITGVRVKKGVFSSMVYLTVPGRTEVSRSGGKSLLRWDRMDEAELGALHKHEAEEAANIIRNGMEENLPDQKPKTKESEINQDPLKLLKLRFVKGEITEKDYNKMKKALKK